MAHNNNNNCIRMPANKANDDYTKNTALFGIFCLYYFFLDYFTHKF